MWTYVRVTAEANNNAHLLTSHIWERNLCYITQAYDLRFIGKGRRAWNLAQLFRSFTKILNEYIKEITELNNYI